MTNADLVSSFAHAMSVTDLAHWGVPNVAYVRQMIVDNDVSWSIHSADGTQIGLAPSREIAFASIRQHDLEPQSTH